MKENNCRRYVTLANALKNKQTVFDYVNNLHKHLGSAMPISKTMLTENVALQALESDCLIACLKDLQALWQHALQEANFEKKNKSTQKASREIVKTGYYPKQCTLIQLHQQDYLYILGVADAVQRWTLRGKLLMKLGRVVGVPAELKSQYMDFVRSGRLDHIENTADPSQSFAFRTLSAQLRKQLPVQDLSAAIKQAEMDQINGEDNRATVQQPESAATTPIGSTQNNENVSRAPMELSVSTEKNSPTPAVEKPMVPFVQEPAQHEDPAHNTAQTPAASAFIEANDSQADHDADHDLPMDDEASTPHKKRTKFSMDSLADWQQALREKVIDWTASNFTLVESVDDISLVDDPVLFIIEEQDNGLTNGPLFRRLLRSSNAKKPLRLVWAVAGLDSVYKVSHAIVSKVSCSISKEILTSCNFRVVIYTGAGLQALPTHHKMASCKNPLSYQPLIGYSLVKLLLLQRLTTGRLQQFRRLMRKTKMHT